MGTKMSVSHPIATINSEMTLTYYEIEQIVQVPGQSTLYVPLDSACHRYELKSVRAEPTSNTTISLKISDRDTGGDVCYESLNESMLYDIVNVPITDKTGKKKIHTFITNSGGNAAAIRIVVKIIPLQGGN